MSKNKDDDKRLDPEENQGKSEVKSEVKSEAKSEGKTDELPDEFDPDGPGFEPVTETYEIQTGARTLPPAGILSVTGRFDLNVRGSEMLFAMAKAAGQEIGRFNVSFRANESSRIVACLIARGQEKGMMPVRVDLRRRQCGIHLGNVFLAHPSLKPVGRRDCMVRQLKSSSGQLVLLILLGSGQVKPTKTRLKRPSRTVSPRPEPDERDDELIDE